jgi:large subunit ribosomal protein L14
MIQSGTKVKIADNSGAKYATCIKVLGGHKRRYAKIGDKIVVSVNDLRLKRRSQAKVQKGKVAYALVIRIASIISKPFCGIFHRYNENSAVLITQQGKPVGSRILGGISRDIRFTKYMRLTTISMGIIK